MLFLLCIERDKAWSAAWDGQDRTRWTRARWAICASQDGATPWRRYRRNGGPVGIVKPVSGDAPPAWMHAAVAHVAAVGGYTLEELADVVEHYRADRRGMAYGALQVAK